MRHCTVDHSRDPGTSRRSPQLRWPAPSESGLPGGEIPTSNGLLCAAVDGASGRAPKTPCFRVPRAPHSRTYAGPRSVGNHPALSAAYTSGLGPSAVLDAHWRAERAKHVRIRLELRSAGDRLSSCQLCLVESSRPLDPKLTLQFFLTESVSKHANGSNSCKSDYRIKEARLLK